MECIDVVAVSVEQRLAMLDSGEVFDLVEFIDGDGDLTDEPDAAVIVIGQIADGTWLSIDMREFENAGMVH